MQVSDYTYRCPTIYREIELPILLSNYIYAQQTVEVSHGHVITCDQLHFPLRAGGRNMIMYNGSSRSVAKGLYIGQDGKGLVLRLGDSFETVHHYAVPCRLQRIEVCAWCFLGVTCRPGVLVSLWHQLPFCSSRRLVMPTSLSAASHADLSNVFRVPLLTTMCFNYGFYICTQC